MAGVTSVVPEDGRARNKRATRAALRRAVVELSAEHGLGSITVDEITARAGVAPRTFFNYFDTKEAAAVIELFSAADEGLAAFAAGSGDAWSDLSIMMTAAVDHALDNDPDLLALLRLHADDPAIQAQQLRYFSAFVARLSDATGKRLGGGRRRRMTADLMAGSCVTAVRVALEHWAAGGGRGRPTAGVAAAFAAFTPAFGQTKDIRS
jgi:AcrR family transcriptional regulator